MKRFHFRLEKLLSLKKHYEKEWELKLARAAGECLRIENEIDGNLMEQARTLKTRKFSGSIEISRLICSELYMLRLSQQNKELEQELTRKVIQREKVRVGYLEASKERKVLDKLKERQGGQFYKLQRDEEMKAVDDINNSTFAKRLIYGGTK